MELDLIAKMKVDELKNFLRLRGLKVSGRKDDLVARVFVASENDVPVVKTAEEVEQEIAKEYSDKLSLEEEVLPDPFQLADGWLKENEGIRYWPTTLYPDIFNFLAFHPSELKSQDLSDYKTSKGYSYYATGWLKPLLYHPVSETSKYCLLKTTCRPSQRISDVPHKLWICLSKETGKILTSHCSCMAGLSQVCNHVAAALFRIEAAVRMGLNSPSCTSKSCAWLPNNKDVQPVKIKDLKLGRADFGTRGKKKGELNCSPKKKFNPLERSKAFLTLSEVATALESVCDEKDSILFTAIEKNTKPTDVKTSTDGIFTVNDFLLMSSSSEELLMHMEYFPSHVSMIETETRGQSENPLWFTMRQHIITASKAHNVKTKVETMKRHAKQGASTVDLKPTFDLISGKKQLNPDIPALRYRQAMESEAVHAFITKYKEEHRNVTVRECGIFLCKDAPFVGGSPDRLIDCQCCGTSCLEIKCPYSIRDKSPIDSDVKLPYLKKNNEIITLNVNHSYYTQCQMAASGIKTSFFYVWTPHGDFTEMINFDEKRWDELKEIFTEFYIEFYVPSLF